MLSIQPLKSAQGAADYYAKAFNYYAGDAQAMQWLGKGCDYLQLNGAVEKETMLQLLEGRLPDGQKLQNFKGEHRPGFDMTFSAPKSVSVLVGLGVAPELIRFHDEAVKKAVAQLEHEFAEARINRDGIMHYEKTGNFIIATFRQPSSRANDPALHTHCVVMNITFLNEIAKSLASDASRKHGVIEQIQNNAHYGGLLYRHHLANLLKEAGFTLRMTGDGLFEIEGVPETVLKEFSRRRGDIEQCLDENGWVGAKSAAIATLLTRPGKEEHDYDVLQADWFERADTLGFDAKAFMQSYPTLIPSDGVIQRIKEKWQSLLYKYQSTSKEADAAQKAMYVAIETLSQRTAVFSERALITEALKHNLVSQDMMTRELIEKAIEHGKKNYLLYEAQCPDTRDTFFTTPWALTLEAETLARIEHHKNSLKPLATHQEMTVFQKERAPFLAYPMTASQKEAMAALLTTKDRYFAIQGYAGVAKTTMLREARLFLESKGIELRGITVASTAANELESKAGIPSSVFPLAQHYLKKAVTGSLTKVLFVVDEASMLSSPQGHELLKQIERTQARLILVGDRAQLPSVNMGRLFGLTQDYGIETAVMDEIVRQKNQDIKEAVIHATKGEIREALNKLEVQALPTHEKRIAWMANRWLDLTPIERNKTLLFAPTHANREAITTLLRAGLKKEGILTGQALLHETLKAKTVEPIQQRFVAYYQKGDVVRFNQGLQKHGIKHSHYYKVDSITPKHRRDNILPLADNEGKRFALPLKSLPHYKTHTAAFERLIEVYQTKSIDLQVGDKVMWTRNVKAQNIRNGQGAVIKAIHNDSMELITSEGQSLVLEKNNPALKHLDYSYVLTNYQVQGKDASYGMGLMESYHRFGATPKNFYVQISRAVHGMTLVTDNKELLVQAIQRNVDEKPASFDVISSKQLTQHQEYFNKFDQASIQAVIEKKRNLESADRSSQFILKNKERTQELER